MNYPMVNSFWSTVEVHCVASGFEYSQYLEWCTKYSKGAPLCEKAYKLLSEVFYVDMEESWKDLQENTLELLS